MSREMKLKGVAILLAAFIASGSVWAGKIKVDGKEYEDAELFEIGAQGPFYKVGEKVLVVPWAEVDRFESAAIRKRFAGALVNLQRKAYWVKGTVFEKSKAGIVVHTGSSSEEGESAEKKDSREEKEQKSTDEKLELQMSKEGVAVYKDGAEVITGLVVLKDLPKSQYEEGADVDVLAYGVGVHVYEMGLGMKKNLMVCTVAKPGWVGARKWKNTAGQDMESELIAVKGGKCLFKRAGKNFVYRLDQLCDADQKLVADFQKNSREFPLKSDQ